MVQRLLSAAMGAGAAVLIFTLLVGGSAFAQDDSTSGDTNLAEAFLNRLAENLGLSRDELDSTIEQTGNEVIDEAVESGELTEERAKALRERIEEPGFGSFGFPFRRFDGPPGPFGHGPHVMTFGLETIAEELGMTTDELVAELRDGTPLTDIITEQGSTIEAVVDAIVTDLQVELNEAVANGHMTQEQADEMLENLAERLTTQIESGMFGPRSWDCIPGDSIPETNEEPDETSI